MWWWVILAVFIVVLVLLLMSSIHTTIRVKREGENDHISLRIRGLYGVIKYHYEVPIIKFKSVWEGITYKAEHTETLGTHHEAEGNINISKMRLMMDDVKTMLKETYGLMDWVKGTMSRVSCTDLEWKTHVGTKDAAETAISVGGVWAVKSWVMGYLFRYIRLETQPEIGVFPRYNHPLFVTQVRCSLSIPTGVALWAGLRLLLRIRKVEGGFRVWTQLIQRHRIGSLLK
jgi:hypothetical protein